PSVTAMGLADSHRFPPGCQVARPMTASPSFAISSFPFGNSRTSSLPTGLLPPAIAVPPCSRCEEQRLTTCGERCSGGAHDVEGPADEHKILGRGDGEGAGEGL